MRLAKLNRSSVILTSLSVFVISSLEPLFFQYGVDLIIEAHEHSYERLWPVFNDTVTAHNYTNPKAPVHLISGAAGCNEFYGICVNPMLGPRGRQFRYNAAVTQGSVLSLRQLKTHLIGWGCAAVTLEPYPILDRDQFDFVTLFYTRHKTPYTIPD